MVSTQLNWNKGKQTADEYKDRYLKVGGTLLALIYYII